MYIILSHYSNENICEFDRIGVYDTGYPTLETAKEAADAALSGDMAAGGVDFDCMVSITAKDNVLPFDSVPAYCTGIALEGEFERFHNLYAVFEVHAANTPL